MDQSYNGALNGLFHAVLTLQNKAECGLFFGDLFTARELDVFAQRLQVARLLYQGNSYQLIHQELPVSNGTISRINTKFCYGSGGYQMVLGRLDETPPNEEDRRQDA